jgi:hypothetical protein
VVPLKKENAPLEEEERAGSGEGGIRTRGRLLTYDGLANRSLRPLGHLSVWLTIADFPLECKPLGAEWQGERI